MGPSLSARSQGLFLPLPLGGTLQRNTTLSLSLVSVVASDRRRQEEGGEVLLGNLITAARFSSDYACGVPARYHGRPLTPAAVGKQGSGGERLSCEERAGVAHRHVTCVDRGINSVLIGRERRGLRPRRPILHHATEQLSPRGRRKKRVTINRFASSITDQ